MPIFAKRIYNQKSIPIIYFFLEYYNPVTVTYDIAMSFMKGVDDMKKEFDFKAILAMVLVAALIIGLFTNRITSQEFIPLVSIVLTFYFTIKKKEED